MQAKDFAQVLLEWYQNRERRAMPWLEEKNPYKIWISEIMLQQTSVKQVIPYYRKFIKVFPDIETLASAEEEEVLAQWQGLGYNSRARHLHFSARLLDREYDANLPKTKNKLLTLKGIGEYTASAIMSFAYGATEPVIDINVIRLFSRLYDRSELAYSKAMNKKITAFLHRAIADVNPAEFNQAIMNFGAEICKDKSPFCPHCPFSTQCLSLKNKTTRQRPRKKKKKSRRNRYFHMLFCSDGREVYLEKRRGRDIWKGMYQMPLLETERIKEVDVREFWEKYFDEKEEFPEVIETHAMKQTLTHQRIHAVLYKIHALPKCKVDSPLQKVAIEDLVDIPLPGLLRKYFKEMRKNCTLQKSSEKK